TEAAQVIPNQQLLINVVSKRVRQLGLGHRPLVETTQRMSLTDIALKEIIAGKLAYESLEDSSHGAYSLTRFGAGARVLRAGAPYAIWRANRSPSAKRFATIAFSTATKRASN